MKPTPTPSMPAPPDGYAVFMSRWFVGAMRPASGECDRECAGHPSVLREAGSERPLVSAGARDG